jgi:hypothetical protein
MSEAAGYWVDMSGPASLAVSGIRPVESSLSLCEGWNLIGYPSGAVKPVTEVLAGIEGKYDLVYGYDAADTGDPWKRYDPNAPFGNDLEDLEPGYGYWIHMTQNATLNLFSR